MSHLITLTTTTLSSLNNSSITTALPTFPNVTCNECNATVSITTLFPPVVLEEPPSSPYNLTQSIIIVIIAVLLSLLTVIGNVMVRSFVRLLAVSFTTTSCLTHFRLFPFIQVMISFKIDKQLQTISNYFLFSLAIADLAIGMISMPLFTLSMILGHWPLGPFVCDTWLALDYLASNASVLNLLIISFDRYFSVTRPLTYRAKRTTNRAAIM